MAHEATRRQKDLTPAEWLQLKEILASVLDLPVSHRSKYLNEQCGEDSELRSRLEDLIAAHDATGAAVLDSPVFPMDLIGQDLHPDVTVADVSDSLLGDTIDHYQVLQKISTGGMGVVYKARDLHLDRFVAIKVLRPDRIIDLGKSRRFIHEARAASALNHPNIITVHDISTEKGLNFIVMEFVDGEPLDKLLARKRLDLVEVLSYSTQVVDALAAAHATGIIHRDIKPANIMVSNNGLVKVLDFGLAKLEVVGKAGLAPRPSDTHTEEGVVLGTVPYMSPEQAMGKKLDARSDIFSFGLVLYEMVAGQAAFKGATKLSILSAILSQEPAPINMLAPRTPPALRDLLSLCLQKDPARRVQSMADVKLALTELEKKSDSDGAFALPHPRSWIPFLERKTYPFIAASLTFMVVLGALLFYSRRAQAFRPGESILLGEVDNRTGNPAFDKTLKEALRIKLHESPYLNIVPQERVREILRRMGHSPAERLVSSLARDVCRRDGARAMLTSSLAASGSSFVISLETLDCQNGASVARAQGEATSEQAVLPALGKAISTLRERLGEPASSIKKFDAPMEQATTPSLAALKAFSIGEEKRAQGDQVGAVSFYLSAIDLDPNFALAYGTLGTIYRNLGELDRAVQFQSKAFALRNRVSEPERLYITAHYYQDVTGEVDKAIVTYEVWAQTYPQDWSPHNNLAVMNLELGHAEKAAVEGREAVRLNPKNTLAYNNLASAYLRLNRFDDAKTTYEAALAEKLDSFSIHRGLYSIAFVAGDLAGIQREINWAKDKPEEYRMLTDEASAAAAQGRMKLSRDFSRRSVEGARHGGFNGPATWIACRQALAEAVVGNRSQAQAWVNQALSIARTQDSLSGGALALALSGDISESKRLTSELSSQYPSDTWVQHAQIPTVKAAMDLGAKKPMAAIDVLQEVKSYELGLRSGFYPTYIRGLAYLQLHHGNEAAAEFQRILDHRGIEPTSPVYPLAHLGLARACILTGVVTCSRNEYRAFLAAWSSADDLPMLAQTRNEFQRFR